MTASSSSEKVSAKKRVMLIDDEQSVLFALRLMLEALGHSVAVFPRGKDAVEELRRNPSFDFVLCDLKMPEMNGLQVLQAIKEICPGVARVLISAHATDAEVHEAQKIGIHGFLGKPFSVEEITGMLR